MKDDDFDNWGELNNILGRLQRYRRQVVEESRKQLSDKPGQAEIINHWVAEAEGAIMTALQPPAGAPRTDGGMLPLIGLGPEVATTLAQAASVPLIPTYDDQINRERLYAIADLYYCFQMEQVGTFRAILKLQQMLQVLFGAETGYDVLEDVLKQQFGERPLTSQRNRMAVAGRDVLRWLAEDYILTDVRIDFEALLEAIVDAADDWLTSAESVGLRKRAGEQGGADIIAFSSANRMQHA